MFRDISNGREKSKLMLIKDSVEQSGRPLLVSVLCNLCQRVEKVHVIGFERDPHYLEDVVPEHLLNRVVLHDGSRDILGWQNTECLNLDTDLVKYLHDQPRNHSNNNVAVVIDSLSPMLLHRPPPYTCQTLARLMAAKIQAAEVEQVVCLVHGDLHDDHSLSLVEHIATTIATVRPSKVSNFLMSCNTLHKKISGKVIKITEHFNLDESYSITDITEIKPMDTNVQMSADVSQPDPTANLTFNLSLTDQEKEARSQVKLPYTYDIDRQDKTLNKSVGEGKIFYQPDEADDFDEEDPDDDLDI